MSMQSKSTMQNKELSMHGGHNLALLVNQLSGQNVNLCYQCHKCAAGCPVVGAMALGPDRIVRMVALNQRDGVLLNRDIWLCAGCFTCWTRCPNEINISAVMDALRQIAIDENYSVAERDAILFHRLFLGVIEYLGRSHEAFTLGGFKVLSQVPIHRDLKAGLGLFLRGKIPILPQRTGAMNEVRKIFQRSK
jgi:heterodisulfide reductase subunit C